MTQSSQDLAAENRHWQSEWTVPVIPGTDAH